MRFFIIIPAHNEAENLHFCLQSLVKQTFRDFQVIVVNDGSTDDTAKIADEFCTAHQQFSVIHLPVSAHQPGAKVVRTFNEGMKRLPQEAEIICKYDADIIFPTDYLEKINQEYERNPRAGMVAGLVRIPAKPFEETKAFTFDDDEGWIFENISSKNHVRGPIKSYRKRCFDDMNGLRPVLGWDNIDVMLAKMHGWETVTVKDLWVKHLRPTAYKYKSQRAEKLGEYFYNIGLNFPLMVVSSAKSALKNRSVSDFLITLKSFLKQKTERPLSQKEIQYIRKLRWKQMINRK